MNVDKKENDSARGNSRGWNRVRERERGESARKKVVAMKMKRYREEEWYDGGGGKSGVWDWDLKMRVIFHANFPRKLSKVISRS